MNQTDHARNLNYSFINGIEGKVYSAGYGKENYHNSKALCEYPFLYDGKMVDPKINAKLLSHYFASYVPFWVEIGETYNNNSCPIMGNVS